MEYLNLGCGYKYVKAPEWLNADMLPVGDDVVHCNFLNGIPFEANRFDLVYHSHVLEHFAKADGEQFIRECYRITKPGGAIRIALPNLELIAKEYLQNIEKALAGKENADKDYDWMMLEMYDQTVRNISGGDMLAYLGQDKLSNEQYVFSRIGDGGRKWREGMLNASKGNDPKKLSVLQKIIDRPSLLIKGLRAFYIRMLLPKKEYQLYKTGQFRFAGEIHQWMYDRYSLGRLLKQAGYKDIVVRSATSSYINNWASYKLDDTTETASLFIEAMK